MLRPRKQKEKGGPGVNAAADAPVTAVAVSACGNFGLVGNAAGRVDRYNMQSGLHRGTYLRQGPKGCNSVSLPPPLSDQACIGQFCRWRGVAF